MHEIELTPEPLSDDDNTINVEMSEELFSDGIRAVQKVERQITEKLRSTLGIGPKVNLVNPKSIERSEGKAKRAYPTHPSHTK